MTGLDLVTGVQHLGEVAQLAVDAGDDDGSIFGKEVSRRGSRRHLLRTASNGDGEVGHGRLLGSSVMSTLIVSTAVS